MGERFKACWIFLYLSGNTNIKCLLFSLLSSKALRRTLFVHKVLLLQVGLGKSISKFLEYFNLKIMCSGRHLVTVVLIGILFLFPLHKDFVFILCSSNFLHISTANLFSNLQNEEFREALCLKWNSSSLGRKWKRSQQKMRLKSPCQEWLKATEKMNKESRSKQANEYKWRCLAAKRGKYTSEETAREWIFFKYLKHHC